MGISETIREIKQGRVEREWARNRPRKPKPVRLNEERDSRDWEIEFAKNQLSKAEQLIEELGDTLMAVVPHLGLSNRRFEKETGLEMSRWERELLQRCVTAGGIEECRKKTHEFVFKKFSAPLDSESDPEDSTDAIDRYNRWACGASAAIEAVAGGDEDWTDEDDK